MIRIPEILVSNSLSGEMLLQVHDELIFEVPENEVEKTTELVKQAMENACEPIIKLDVPLVVESGAGSNWSEAH
jgi:DNA polymerase-1